MKVAPAGRLLCVWLLLGSAAPTLAQISGDLIVTDMDFFDVMVTSSAQQPLQGGGAPLWAGNELIFEREYPPQPSNGQVYRAVVASLSAPPPAECHDDTVALTVSVQVFNLGPQAGFLYSGALRLLRDGLPAQWLQRALATAAAPTGGAARVLSVSATVPADDLVAGRVFVELDLETYDTGRYKSWRTDQFQATYVFGTSTCGADLAIEKSAAPSAVPAGGDVSYTLVATNDGPQAADGAVVTDPGAPELDCTSLSCTASGGATCPVAPTPAQLAAGLAIPTLPVGGSVSLVLNCTLGAVP